MWSCVLRTEQSLVGSSSVSIDSPSPPYQRTSHLDLHNITISPTPRTYIQPLHSGLGGALGRDFENSTQVALGSQGIEPSVCSSYQVHPTVGSIASPSPALSECATLWAFRSLGQPTLHCLEYLPTSYASPFSKEELLPNLENPWPALPMPLLVIALTPQAVDRAVTKVHIFIH